MVVLEREKSSFLKNLNVRWKESIPHKLKRKQSMNPMDYKPIDSILNNVEDTV